MARSRLALVEQVVRTHGKQPLRRSFAVYAMGDGWTGALGHEHIRDVIPGHFDEEHEDINNNTEILTVVAPTSKQVYTVAGIGNDNPIVLAASRLFSAQHNDFFPQSCFKIKRIKIVQSPGTWKK